MIFKIIVAYLIGGIYEIFLVVFLLFEMNVVWQVWGIENNNICSSEKIFGAQ